MIENTASIQDRVIEDLEEGILVIASGGTILYANQSASSILCVPLRKLTDNNFSALFIDDPANDGFVQMVLDAVQDREKTHRGIVEYSTGKQKKYLRLGTTYFKDEETQSYGIIMLLDDLSELMELRDSVKAMKQIRELNDKLEERNHLLSSTFGMFLSDEIVTQLIDEPGGLNLGGKKMTVTMLMSDLRGFTAISERMEASGLIDMLNHYLGEMTEVIQAHEGTIIEFIGDGIMAVFGAPVNTDSHAEDAVAAALEMQDAMEAINQWNKEREYPRLEMGIGIDTGEVIVGNIGSTKRMKYGVVGSHVNLCGRIESYTVGGQILISPDVRERISAELRIDKELTVKPKGMDEEIVLTDVTGMGAPYNIQINVSSDIPKALNEPIPVTFYRISSKQISDRACYGGIVSVGRDSAVLETGEKLEVFDNFQIQAGGHLLCKVIEKMENGYLIQYTAIPSGYANWLRAAVRRQERRT